MLSEGQEIHVSSVFLEYHPPSERCAFAADGAGRSLPTVALSYEQVQDEIGRASCRERV